MHKAVTYYPSFFLFLFSYFSIFYCKVLFNPYKYYSYLPKELLWTKELLCSLVCYLFVKNVYAFFTLKKTLKRPFKAILKSFKLLLIFYRIHFIFSFFTLHTLQPRTRKSYPHFHKPFKFAILRGCSSLFTYTVFLILLFLLHPHSLHICTISSNSFTLRATGFSQIIFFPAFAAFSTISLCL